MKRHRTDRTAPERIRLSMTGRIDRNRRRILFWLVPTALAAGVSSIFFEMVWPMRPGAHTMAPASATNASSTWHVGMLRPNGLRIIPSGRNDASRVLSPEQFSDPEIRHAYWVATQIPATLNQLYCWCGCENTGEHRSNLQCFEDKMAVSCDVCRGTAEIAFDMTRKGVIDAGRIQAAVDAKWAPKGHADAPRARPST
ncbi:PCYCGC motif-containing (lipo)protein (plasmid) [Burkholderia pyrrocinia]|uniref:PCYCGC motif-containing (lipo)protein n=1 Tax=Burkholderia pyrrocinia TaxID=60550 RepID=UPI0038B4F5CC